MISETFNTIHSKLTNLPQNRNVLRKSVLDENARKPENEKNE